MVLNAVMDTLSSALNTASVNYGNEEWGVTDELAAPGKREGEGEGGGGGTYFPPTVVEMMHADLDAMSAHAQQLFREAAGAQVEGQRGAATDKLEHPANRTGRTGPAESVRTEAAASGRDAFAQALASPLSTPHTLPHMSSLGADAADARAAPPAVSSPSSQPSSTSRGYRFGDVTRSVVRRTRDWHQTRQQRREMSRSQPPATSKAEKEEEKLLPGIPKLMGRQLSDGGRQILRDQLSRCVGGPTFTTLHHFHLGTVCPTTTTRPHHATIPPYQRWYIPPRRFPSPAVFFQNSDHYFDADAQAALEPPAQPSRATALSSSGATGISSSDAENQEQKPPLSVICEKGSKSLFKLFIAKLAKRHPPIGSPSFRAVLDRTDGHGWVSANEMYSASLAHVPT
jgi:hypothetical protein